ncbi:MAG TPA: acyltransferase [Sphingomonas sp.]|nr:acyltransferase [Sphingomonas sp.]
MRALILLWLANHMPPLRWGDKARALLARWAGVRMNGHCSIRAPLEIRPVERAAHVAIGRHCFINSGVRFAVPRARVTIGARCQIGPGVFFETVSHGLVFRPGIGRGDLDGDIVVEDEVWIGARAIIGRGVTIGRGAVIGAGAVVTRDVPTRCFAAGVPARVVREIDYAAEAGEPA